jgi:carbon storage regulator
MLVLSRKRDQGIFLVGCEIGDEIEITVVGLKSGRVWLGIDAPRHIEVHRKEVKCEVHED